METKKQKIERLGDEFANTVFDNSVSYEYSLQKYYEWMEAKGERTLAQMFKDEGITVRCAELRPESEGE